MVIAARPHSGGGAVEGAGGRLQDCGRDRPATRQERDADAPLLAAAQKGAGAIDRIDDIGAFRPAIRQFLEGLLGQPSIGRAGGEQPVGEKPVDGEVGIADRRAVGLGPARDAVAEMLERGITRGTDRILDQRAVGGEGLRFRQGSSPARGARER
jgi:hypothetical protein